MVTNAVNHKSQYTISSANLHLFCFSGPLRKSCSGRRWNSGNSGLNVTSCSGVGPWIQRQIFVWIAGFGAVAVGDNGVAIVSVAGGRVDAGEGARSIEVSEGV